MDPGGFNEWHDEEDGVGIHGRCRNNTICRVRSVGFNQKETERGYHRGWLICVRQRDDNLVTKYTHV